jgi:hypothetical protein
MQHIYWSNCKKIRTYLEPQTPFVYVNGQCPPVHCSRIIRCNMEIQDHERLVSCFHENFTEFSWQNFTVFTYLILSILIKWPILVLLYTCPPFCMYTCTVKNPPKRTGTFSRVVISLAGWIRNFAKYRIRYAEILKAN